MDGPVVKSKIQEDQDSRLQIMIEDKVFTISDSDSDDDKNKDERPLDSQRTVLTRKNFRRQLQSYLRASYSPGNDKILIFYYIKTGFIDVVIFIDKCELKPEVCDTWKRPDERLEASSGKQKVVASVDKHESADLQDSQHAAVEPISGKILSPLILTKAGIPNGPGNDLIKKFN